MDFGDVISLIVFLIFIVSPFLKRRKKKASGAGQSGRRRPSLFSQLGDALKDAARELEKQAELARKKEALKQGHSPRAREGRQLARDGEKVPVQTFWDDIDDRESQDRNDADSHHPDKVTVQIRAGEKDPESVNEKRVIKPFKKESHRKAPRIPDIRETKGTSPSSSVKGVMGPACPRFNYRRLPAQTLGLQKAVIWSEILGRPVALRDQNSLGRHF